MAREISRLPVPQSYQLQLVEVFSAFHWHLDRLMTILRPAAQRLEPLLAPWVEQAIPRAEEWERYLQEPTAMQTMLQKTGLKEPEICRLEIALRYFFPFGGPGEFQHPVAHLSLHLGVGIPPGKDAPETPDLLRDWEFTALRLMVHPDRARMLRAMTDHPMSVQDLSQSLGLNPGSVFRDLNNMNNAGLLTQEIISNRIHYRTDSAAVERLTKHLVSYLHKE